MSTATSPLSKQEYMLGPFEYWWACNYNLIFERGYRLRDRYAPNALDSWLNGIMSDDEARRKGLLDKPVSRTCSSDELVTTALQDDDIDLCKGMDAQRVSDNGQVWIKRCSLKSPDDPPESVMELVINAMIKDENDPQNRFLPLLDHFVVHDETSWEFIDYNERFVCLVFPWVIPVDQHPWRIAAEAMDFVRQLLEGLSFLHRRRIAHRDIHRDNILMSPLPIFYAGVNPLRNINVTALMDDLIEKPYRDRIEVPASYWYIDLGLSSYFREGSPHQVSWEGGVHKLPEVFGTTTPSVEERLNPPAVLYDPFVGDVWQLGTTLRIFFGKSIPSLNPLFRAMTDWDPSKRPTADQCLADFHVRTDRLPRWQLLLPVRDASWMKKIPDPGWLFTLRLLILHYREWFRLAKKAIRLGLPKPRS
ncbi:hypothetical protein EXIGLDRAFT_744343 [Exidia glandulosa HHB12029]|uniref:Protein kinase domain-containing protein n=1 Tax=Exidia glandulosa HHB12029 TaxID=1314781 RepID=A0A165PY68_EXIGL|nr:hypothetical protein EXIGLDRAFT_744343 [Exidia glandulosa HHB12029]